MKKVSKILTLAFLSFTLMGFSDLFAFCLVTSQRDRVPICTAGGSCRVATLRYKVEREYNALGGSASCTTGDHDGNYSDGDSDPYDDWLGFEQAILFATAEWGNWGVPDVNQINLRGPINFDNSDSDKTLVVGNWPQELPDPDDAISDFVYRAGYSVFEDDYGSVTLNASTTSFADDQTPFTCGTSTEVTLRHLVIVTKNVTKEEIFSRASCLRDGGQVYVCTGIMRAAPNSQPDDVSDLSGFTQEEIDAAWCDADSDYFNTMENDCNDSDPAINPDATEICGNLVDENCNDVLNEGCVCTPGVSEDCGSDVGVCESGTRKCGPDGQWSECSDVGPSPEICDGAPPADEDCNGVANEGCLCTPGETRPCGSAVGLCSEGIETCSATGLSWGACTGAVGPAVETCDGILDEDCDGTVDEGCTCANGNLRTCGTTDVGACEVGTQTCTAGAWDACVGNIEPAPEVCGGATDENCDGIVNEACVCVPGAERLCGLAVGACAFGTEICSADGLSWGACTGGVGPAAEVCDTLDNDCDGETDETDAANPRTWYTDADGDTFGNPRGVILACNLPAGAVADNTDCSDTNPLINPRAAEVCGNGLDDNCDGTIDELPTWYQDADGDSYGNLAEQIADCLSPLGYVDNSDDCDDTRASVHPLGLEICADGIDQNCDGTDPVCPPTDEDGDGDGYCPDLDRNGICTDGTLPGDCNDADTSIRPGAPEVCGDGIDQNCDAIDPGCVVDIDNDGDGYCDDSNLDGICNDGTIPGDCDDAVAAVNPGATEICDGTDNNCNGLIDEASAVGALTWYPDFDGDTYGNPSFNIVSCSRIPRFVADGTDCNDNSAGINPGAIEICDDGIDQDCSGRDLLCTPAADTDDDGDGFCEDGDGNRSCTDGSRPGDCNDANGRINPEAAEICDGIDNNCDRIVDLTIVDDDGDGYFSSCPRDCVDSDGNINPAASEVCGDGIDNNCDGMDLACPDGPDEPEDKDDDDFTVDFDCNDLNKNVNPDAAEICDGIDNNCDGLVDFADPDGDGFFGPCPIDCNNADETIYPGAMEICFDDIDNNCNEVIDEGCPIEPPIDCDNPTVAASNPICIPPPGESPDPPVTPPTGFPAAIEGGGGCGLTEVPGSFSLISILLTLLPMAMVGRKRIQDKKIK